MVAANTSEEAAEHKGLPFSMLMRNFFTFSEGAATNTKITRLLSGNSITGNNRGIVGAIINLQEQVKKLLVKKTEIDNLTMKKALIFYFEHKNRINFIIDDRIDKKVLDIFGEVYLKYFHKKETTRKPLLIPKE